MSAETIIKVDGLSKKFRRYSSVGEGIKEVLHPLRKKYHEEFWALRDISLGIERGESVGIVGRNGSGKSTLLQVLCGILRPDGGTVEVGGRVSALLELGAGFHPRFSGRENVYLNAAIMGLSRQETEARMDDILAFADIGDFVDQPVRTYSSGMFVRLAFAAAIHVEPDILVVDEALAVGDAFFQQKCLRRIKEMKEAGVATVFVSHDMTSVKMLCDRAVLLEGGTVMEEGDPEKVTNRYNLVIAGPDYRDRLRRGGEKREEVEESDHDAWVSAVDVAGEKSGSNLVSSGERTAIGLEIRSRKDLGRVNVGVAVRDKYGQDIFGTNLFCHDRSVELRREGTYRVTFTQPMDIKPGNYTVTVAISREDSHVGSTIFWNDLMASIEVAGFGRERFGGLVRLDTEVEISEAEAL